MASRKSFVLVIDDQNGITTKRHLEGLVNVIVRHPNDVTEGDLKRCNLVLVDFKLDEWPERNDQSTPSLMPQTGIALIAVLRSNLSRLRAAPTAFALNSGLLSDLSNGGEWEGREHAIAKSIDLEWVFAKTSNRPQFARGVKSLTEAVAALPAKWPAASKTKDQILKLLSLSTRVRWRQSAIDAIDRSHPPHEILIGNSSGIAVLRWLLHVILP
ncbi:hypothetical protein SAMN05216330_103613 [Bradyrhizobium sp. Ghvi]|uniref:hypothetical protein n=1 Tax=Bradyrhizobium sp. Ghvi TaxID=1855319 RepID=UPI0008EA9A7A|nr:hypothetical protein [Bradyrhizobium sp. Ghvi]SFO55804.1 hypothetical protein SAMN05216330_103613 [Bradyrhizobium sp. Ghvi]